MSSSDLGGGEVPGHRQGKSLNDRPVPRGSYELRMADFLEYAERDQFVDLAPHCFAGNAKLFGYLQTTDRSSFFSHNLPR